jgi:hypothetical protein
LQASNESPPCFTIIKLLWPITSINNTMNKNYSIAEKPRSTLLKDPIFMHVMPGLVHGYLSIIPVYSKGCDNTGKYSCHCQETGEWLEIHC